MHCGIGPVPELAQGKTLGVYGMGIRQKQERAGWWAVDLVQNLL